MKEFNEHGERIEEPKKKKLNLFSGYTKDGKEIKKEDVIKNYDFLSFFKLYGRRFIKLIWVNALYIVGNFPIFFLLLALSGLFSNVAFTEYRARRNCVREYAGTIELPLIERDDYGLRPFVREVAADISGRCVKCYEMRLFETARAAAEGGFDSFTSSLFISPYQNHELMRDVAERAAHEYGVEFLYRDFRPYFRDGQTFAREHDFYIQKYCGCVFSEQERYLKPKKIIP